MSLGSCCFLDSAIPICPFSTITQVPLNSYCQIYRYSLLYWLPYPVTDIHPDVGNCSVCRNIVTPLTNNGTNSQSCSYNLKNFKNKSKVRLKFHIIDVRYINFYSYYVECMWTHIPVKESAPPCCMNVHVWREARKISAWQKGRVTPPSYLCTRQTRMLENTERIYIKFGIAVHTKTCWRI